MSDQIASITLRADVADLRTASSELDKLGKAADGAVGKADDLNRVFRAGADTGKQSAAALWEQQKSFKGLLESIDPTLAALGKLDDQQQKLRSIHSKGLLDTEEFTHYQKILDATRLKLTDTGEAAAKAQAELAATKAAEKQSASLKKLLGSIDPTIRAFNSLDEQHAQLVAHFEAGRIDSKQFEHFNDTLNQTRQRLAGVADALPEALKRQQIAAQKAGISVGQYNQALRTLPAQFTDIATQLAGGQSPFLILLQQGGQIKDSFGGVKGAISGVGSYLRGLLGLLNPVTLGIGALVVGAGALATAWYKGSQEATEFNKQLILTGNYSARSASQLSALAQKIGGASGRVADAARALAQVVGARTFKTDQLETVTRAALAMQEATGQSVDATIKNFQKLYDAPTKASEELNSTLHFLTSAQYDYIASLERRGDKEGAAAAAAKAYGDAEQKRSQQIIDNMGLIDRVLRGAADAWGKYWDAAMGIGRKTSDSERLEQVKQQIKILSDTSRPGVFGVGNIGDGGANARQIAVLRQQQKSLEFVIQSQEGYASAVKAAQEADDKRTKSLIYQNQVLEQSMTWQQKRSRALSELWKNVAIAPDKWSDQQRQQAVDGINKQFHPNKTPKTPAVKVSAGDRTLENYRAQARTLTETLETLRQTSQTHAKNTELSKQQSRFAELDEAAKTRSLTAQEKSLLSSREAILNAAKVVDQKNKEVEAQQKINGLSQQATKFAEQQAAKRAEIAAATKGISTQEAKRLVTLQRITDAYSDNLSAQKEVLAQLRQTYKEEDDLRSNWLAGAKQGWADYVEDATNAYGAVKIVAGSALTGLSDMLTDLMLTGRASIKAFGMSMLKMIAEVVNRLMVAYAVQAAMGWVSGNIGGASAGSTPGGAYANAAAGVSFDSGGYTGAGGKYEPAGIVHRDEFVFTKEATRRIGVDNLYRLMNNGNLGRYATGGLVGGNQTGASDTGVPIISVSFGDINIGSGGQASTGGSANAAAIGKQLNDAMVDTINTQVRKPGTPLWNAVRGKY